MPFSASRFPRALLVSLGLIALAAPCLLAGDTAVPASPAEIAAEKTTRATLEKALAADPQNLALRIQLGEVLSDLGAFGDKNASDAAVKLFELLHQESPQDAVILADYGNARTIYAQYASVFTQLNWVHGGFDDLDAAVKAAPDNAGIRITRALNSSQVPAFLKREQIARDDFAWLLARIHSRPQDFTADQLRTIYFYDGHFALDHNDAAAVQLLDQAAAVPPPAGDTLAPKIADSLKIAHAKFPAAPAAPAASSPPVAKNS